LVTVVVVTLAGTVGTTGARTIDGDGAITAVVGVDPAAK
jgi:hypothetical protein